MINEIVSAQKTKKFREAYPETFINKFIPFLNECKKFTGSNVDVTKIAESVQTKLSAALQLHDLKKLYPLPESTKYKSAINYLGKEIKFNEVFWSTLYGWLVVNEIGRIQDDKDNVSQSRRFIDEWLFGKLIYQVLLEIGFDDSKANQTVALIKLLTSQQNWFSGDTPKTNREYHLLNHLISDQEVQSFLQVNRHENTLWFNKEAFEIFVLWIFVISIIDIIATDKKKKETKAKEIADRYGIIQKWLKAEKTSGYQVEKLLEGLKRKGKKKGKTC
jgi:hypothetical protein